MVEAPINTRPGAYEIPSAALVAALWRLYELPRLQREAQRIRQAHKDTMGYMEGQ